MNDGYSSNCGVEATWSHLPGETVHPSALAQAWHVSIFVSTSMLTYCMHVFMHPSYANTRIRIRIQTCIGT